MLVSWMRFGQLDLFSRQTGQDLLRLVRLLLRYTVCGSSRQQAVVSDNTAIAQQPVEGVLDQEH